MKTLASLLILIACAFVRTSAQDSVPAVGGPTAPSTLGAEDKVLYDTLRPPADFLDVDKQPELITKKEPVYPVIAMKAGMEGKVWLKVWVDNEGRPRDVQVLKSDAQVFNQAAIDAAWAFRFRPAYLKDKPVDVWVSIPFQFKLSPKASSDSTGGTFPKDIIDFVRSVLQGGGAYGGQIEALVHPDAQAVAGGYLVKLTTALREQQDGQQSIEQSKRKVAFVTGHMSEKGFGGYLVVRTEASQKKAQPHYHTVVIEQDGGGLWRIMHWHTWHGSR